MTPEEQCQAIMDNAAGYDMQIKSLIPHMEWEDRRPAMAGEALNLRDYEYRRKPELIERFVNVYKDGRQELYSTYKSAKNYRLDGWEKTVALVEKPDWKEPKEDTPLTEEENKLIEQGLSQIKLVDKYRKALEIIAGIRPAFDNLMGNADIARAVLKSREPEPEEMNPWRPIVKGEWPECKPGKLARQVLGIEDE